MDRPTDLERFEQTMKDFGVSYEKIVDKERIIIEMRSGEHKKVSGYTGFFTSFIFNLDGSFVEMGAWE